MFSSVKTGLRMGLVAAVLVGAPSFLRAEEDYSPTKDGGHFGLGLEWGDPGSWGVTGKFWFDQVNAFQGAVKLPGGQALLQLDYLWHDFDVFHMRNPEGEIPVYLGVGGSLSLGDPAVLSARVPVGVSYLFDKTHVPVDFYFQVVMSLTFPTPMATLTFYPEAGAHYYF